VGRTKAKFSVCAIQLQCAALFTSLIVSELARNGSCGEHSTKATVDSASDDSPSSVEDIADGLDGLSISTSLPAVCSP